jgi:lipid A 3-O-deacylase
MNRFRAALASLVLPAAVLVAAPAIAQEAFVGAYAHGVETPFTFETGEGGADLQAGYRFAPIEAVAAVGRPQPYVFGSLNTSGDTSFVAAGLSWKIGVGPVFVRPGIGLALHDAPGLRVDPASRRRTDLGSRILFEPEIAIGAQVSDRLSLEASWVHISNAQLFNSEQNPGIDMMGVRLSYRLR